MSDTIDLHSSFAYRSVMLRNEGKVLGYLVAMAAILTAAILGVSFYFSSSSIHELLTENYQLNQAIRNLAHEESIGYALVQEQSRDEFGQVETVVRFVQTAAGKPELVVSEQLFHIPGDVIHFDAMIVKFDDQVVREGKQRALYLWRRVYGEHTAPDNGESIEVAGAAPERYYDAITQKLRNKDQQVFWDAIWSLSNNPLALDKEGITAVYGNVSYLQMIPGKVYRFKIGATGQIYPEVSNLP
ncbi:hypothetical protein [Coraliomargarita parva]|uniref:hypothetical protein n=1 Tax=Coraliomargarita parva TaxID=3014050 RepID=UPI0022B3AB10|nr:hypothetical protein [Coraliomargarita parva]